MDKLELIKRIEDVLQKGRGTTASLKTHTSRAGNSAWLDPALLGAFRAAGIALLADLYGKADQRYVDFLDYTRSNMHPPNVAQAVAAIGVVKEHVENGWLDSTRGLIAGEVFGDFLEMAQHLVDEGYKDAAAVIAGSSLEAHLKRMCQKVGISIEAMNGKHVLVPKKADALNSELAAVGVYGKSEQKQITAWLGTRNDAAHGEYARVIRDVVVLMIAGIRDFTLRYPA